MLIERIGELYRKFRLVSYRGIFGSIHEKKGSLSATEAFAADVIYLLDGPTPKQFADYIGISQPNATYKINSLITKGYVEKAPSEKDRRESSLHVSEKFHKYFKVNNQEISRAVSALEGEYTREEIDKFSDMLETLSSYIKKD